MSSVTTIIVAIAVTIVASIVLGSAGRVDRRSLAGYFWGRSSLSISQGTNLLLSTSFSMTGLMYQVWLGYDIGIAALWLQVIWCTGFILLARFGPSLNRLVRTGTIHGVIGDSFGGSSERAAAVASVIGFTMQAGMELVVGISIFSVISSNAGFLAILVLCISIVAASYTMLGGLRGNLLANEIQNMAKILAVLGIIAFLWLTLNRSAMSAAGPIGHGVGVSFTSLLRSHQRLLPSLGLGGLIANAAFSLVWQFVDMSCWQSLASTSDDEPAAISRTLFSSAFWIFLFPGFVGTIIGMLLTAVPGLSSDTVMLDIFGKVLSNPWMTFLVTVGFVAAILSTIDGLLLAAGQAISWDLTRHQYVQRVLSFWHSAEVNDVEITADNYAERVPSEIRIMERSILTHTRTSIIILALVGAISFLWIQSKGVSLFNLVYFAYCGQMALLPTVLGCLTGWRAGKGSGLLSILLGLLLGFSAAFVGLLRSNNDLITWSPVLALTGAFFGLVLFSRRIVEDQTP